MDDPRILRIITVGLVLAALAVIYFLFTGGFSVNKSKVSNSQTTKTTQSPSPVAVATQVPAVVTQTPTPTPSATDSAAVSGSTGNTSSDIALNNTTKGGVPTLPRTGFPAGLVFTFSASAVAFGIGLHRFPK